MNGKTIFVLVAALVLCACSQTTQPLSSGSSQVPLVTDTFYFPTTRVGAEFDTTILFHLQSPDMILRAELSDSNWRFLNPLPMVVSNGNYNSQLSFRFAPTSQGKQTGRVLFYDPKYEAALFTLTGNASKPNGYTTDSINFGTVSIWRAVDTAVVLRLRKQFSITSIHFPDSSWSTSTGTPVLSATDSSLVLRIHYMPVTLADHQGRLLLLSDNDTIAILALKVITIPFERYVGDSYVFQTVVNGVSGIDSVWIAALPLKISTSSSNRFDQKLQQASMDTIGDWTMPIVIGGAYVRLPFVSKLPYQTSAYHQDTNGVTVEHMGSSSSAIAIGDSSVMLNGYHLDCTILSAVSSWDIFTRIDRHQSSSATLSADYVSDIGFLTFADYVENGIREQYQLVRFHPRR